MSKAWGGGGGGGGAGRQQVVGTKVQQGRWGGGRNACVRGAGMQECAHREELEKGRGHGMNVGRRQGRGRVGGGSGGQKGRQGRRAHSQLE